MILALKSSEFHANDNMNHMRPAVYASGFLLFRKRENLEFLLMRHANRWDLPKGRLDFGESKLEAAIRELHEESAVSTNDFWIDPTFVFESRYFVSYSKQQSPMLKELSIFLGYMTRDVELVLTEHASYQWFQWLPPHNIQEQTIDPLLEQVDAYFETLPNWPPKNELV